MSELILNFQKDFPAYKIIDVCANKGWNKDFKVDYITLLIHKARKKPENIYVIETIKIPKKILHICLSIIEDMSVKEIVKRNKNAKFIFFNKGTYGLSTVYDKLFVNNTLFETNQCLICDYTYLELENDPNAIDLICQKCFNSLCKNCSNEVKKLHSDCPFCLNPFYQKIYVTL
jgi:hypothetical protein